MTKSFIIAARRSPVAPRNGALAGLPVEALAAPVIRQVLYDAGLAAEQAGEIILSNALGAGGNPARIAALAAGLPQRVAGLTVDRQCAGGLDALLLAGAMVQSGQQEVVIAGGAESYSRRPLRHRTFADGSPPQAYDQAQFTPWPDRDPGMAEAAAALAAHLGISRAAQDSWAADSHQAARQAQDSLAGDLCPVGGLDHDPFTRRLTLALCARAKPVSGSITAANMAVAADGAAFAVVVSERIARQSGFFALEITAGRTLGGDPAMPGLAPVAAIGAVLQSAGWRPEDLSAAEIMEAFAVQAIACQQGAGIARGIVNADGGALARGHPVGASGAILMANLYHRLRRVPGRGLAAIASAGGLGTALLAEPMR